MESDSARERALVRKELFESDEAKFVELVREKTAEELYNLLEFGEYTGYSMKEKTIAILNRSDLLNRAKMFRILLRNKFASKVAPSVERVAPIEGFTVLPTTTWEDVGGYREVKEQILTRFAQYIINPTGPTPMGLEQTSLLLHGPPGVGKTMLIEALVNKINNDVRVNYIRVQGPEIQKSAYKDTVDATFGLFERARSHPPCILFFDNLDFYTAPTYEGKVLGGLLKRLIEDPKNRGKVFIVGTAIRLDLVDSSLLSSVFGTQIPVPKPTAEDIQLILEGMATVQCVDTSNISFDEIANRLECKDLTGASLKMLMIQAGRFALCRRSAIITAEHLNQVMRHVKKEGRSDSIFNVYDLAERTRRPSRCFQILTRP